MKRTGIKRGPGNPIPEASRRSVEEREGLRCLRCGGRGVEWHHRRGRRVKDDHTHCTCNGVLLCGTCHRWAHTGEVEDRDGYRVPHALTYPGLIPIVSWHGRILLSCDGQCVPINPGDIHPPT